MEVSMKRKLLILLAVVAMACWFPGQAAAFIISVNTGVSTAYSLSQAGDGAAVEENYNAQDLVNGQVVDSGNANPYFDKKIFFTSNDIPNHQDTQQVTLTFHVTNGFDDGHGNVTPGPYTWTDYHFLLSTDSTFTILSGDVTFKDGSSADLKQVTVQPYEIDMSIGAPGSKTIDPGDVANFTIKVETTDTTSTTTPYYMRQIATVSAVPLPGALLLLGGGLVRLVAYGRRKRQATA
jgi:hypothetical protein